MGPVLDLGSAMKFQNQIPSGSCQDVGTLASVFMTGQEQLLGQVGRLCGVGGGWFLTVLRCTGGRCALMLTTLVTEGLQHCLGCCPHSGLLCAECPPASQERLFFIYLKMLLPVGNQSHSE